MTKLPPCIHIGVPKTGTGTLQNGVFPNHPQIAFLGWSCFSEVEGFSECLYGDSMYENDEAFAACAKRMENYLTKHDGVILFSREHLTHDKYNKGLFATRLKRIFGDAKIILTIRRQSDWIASSYAWYVRSIRRPWRGGFPPSLESYLKSNWADRLHSRFASCDYASIARAYGREFGKEKVGVFLFEEMVSNPERFNEKLCKFIGVDQAAANPELWYADTNPRMTTRQYLFWRWRALILPLGVLYLFTEKLRLPGLNWIIKGGTQFQVELPRHWRERIDDHYRSGNSYLAANFSLPLEEYGYQLLKKTG